MHYPPLSSAIIYSKTVENNIKKQVMRAVFARPRVGGCSRAHPSMYSPRRPSCQSTVAAHLCSWGAAPGSEMRLQNCRNLAGGFNGKSHQSRRIPQHSSYFQWKTSDLSQGVTVLFPIVALCAVCFRVWVALRAKVFVAGGPTQAVVVLASFAGIPLENAEIRVNVAAFSYQKTPEM